MSKNTRNNFELLEDEDLLALDIVQRQEVLHELYRRYEKRIYFKSLSLLKNQSEARDLTHDIFIKIFTNLQQFNGNSRFSLWVHSISYNTCLQYLKTKRKIHLFELTSDNDQIVDEGDEILSEKIKLDFDLDFLDESLKSLRKEERILILMKYIDLLSIKEISDITKLSDSAVKMRLKRSRDKMLTQFEQRKESSGSL